MPFTKEQRKLYLKNLRSARRSAWIKENGPCKLCGGSERLEVDHIERSTKSYPVGVLWTRSKQLLETELKKCQVLCNKCHKTKTRSEFKKEPPHGTYTGYSYHRCRCALCVEAKRKTQAEYRSRTCRR